MLVILKIFVNICYYATMVQVFFVTEVFLLYSAALILSDTYGTKILSLIYLRNFIYGKKIARDVTYVLCIVLILANIFFPMSPGPMFLGDFLPVLNLLMLLFYFLKRFNKEEKFIDAYKKYDIIGYISLAVSLVHLILPNFVIL